MAAAPRAVVPCLDGLAETVRRLRDHFQVVVKWEPLADDLGIWNSTTKTMIVNQDSCLADQTWLLIDLWKLLNLGPQYAPAAQLVPEQRSLRLITHG